MSEMFDCHCESCLCTAADAPPHRWSDEVTDAEITAARSIGILAPNACKSCSGILLDGDPGDDVLWIRLRDGSGVGVLALLDRIEAAHPGCLLRGMCNEGALAGEVQP